MEMQLSVYPRWQEEAEKHWRAGDYAWMAGHVGGRCVLEIGCGAGFSTLALVQAGCTVLVLEVDEDCRAAAAARLEAAGGKVAWLTGDLLCLSPEAKAEIVRFAPTAVVCWMFGVPDTALDPNHQQHVAVQRARELAHCAVAALAADLPAVDCVHLVDRTAFPWKIKDTARDTLVMIHSARTFAGSPFTCRREDALYRKLDPSTWPESMQRGAGSGIAPVLGSLIARRDDNLLLKEQ